MSDMYHELPFDEVLGDISNRRLDRMETLLWDPAAPPEGNETVTERLANFQRTRSADHAPNLTTHFQAFVPLFNDLRIGSPLVSAQVLPSYLLGACTQMGLALEARYARYIRIKTYSSMRLLADAIKNTLAQRWQDSLPDRMDKTSFNLMMTPVSNVISAVAIRMIHSPEGWDLGFHFEEERSYLRDERHTYRYAGGSLFIDPVGSEGDISNYQAGSYLPSRFNVKDIS